MRQLFITGQLLCLSFLFMAAKMPKVIASPLSPSQEIDIVVKDESSFAESCFSQSQLECQTWEISQNTEISPMSPANTTPDTPSEITPETKPTQESAPQNESSNDSEGWHFKFQPYAILPVSIYGDASIKGLSINYHGDLGDVFDALTFAIAGRFEMWKDNFGLIVDANYASLEGSGFKSSRRPNINATLQSTLKYNQGIYTLALSYHLGDPAVYHLSETPSNKSFPQIWFEPIVGLRINNINASIKTELTLENLDRSSSRTVSNGITWLQPLVGGKLGLQVSDPVTFWVLGNVSGFGISGDTDISWSVIGAFDWWVTRSISLQLGYGLGELNYKDSNNGFKFNSNFNGPFLSATFNF